MKKGVVVCVIMFISAGFLGAQMVRGIAINSGIVWSKQNWNYQRTNMEFPTKYCTGFHIGVNAEFLHHKHLSLLTELGYIEKGFMAEFDITTPDSPEGGLGTIERKFVYNYIYFSPQLKIRKDVKNFMFYLFLGPRLDFKVTYPSDFPADNIIILGFNLGVGFEYIIGPVGLGIIYHYQGDITPLYKKKSRTGSNYRLVIRNSAVVLDLGVKFYFGKD